MISLDKLKKISDTLQLISDDTEEDVKHFDHQLFNGKTVAEYFGVIGAQIQALANITKKLVDDQINEITEGGKNDRHL